MTPDLQDVAQRLNEIEKQVGHLAAIVTEHSDTDRSITARSFIVRDEHGKRRAELGMEVPTGRAEAIPLLGLFDNENVRALISLPEEGPMIQLSHPRNKAVVDVDVDEHGPQIDLRNANGKRSLYVVAKQDEPQVTLFDANEKRRLLLLVSPSGEPCVFMYDASGRVRMTLQASSTGEPVLVMYDGNAQPRLSLELSSAGEPYLQMCDAKGDARANLSVEGDPRLKFGKDNTVLWSAP